MTEQLDDQDTEKNDVQNPAESPSIEDPFGKAS